MIFLVFGSVILLISGVSALPTKIQVDPIIAPWKWSNEGNPRSWTSSSLTMKHNDDGVYLMQPLWSWTDSSHARSGKDDQVDNDRGQPRKEFIPFNSLTLMSLGKDKSKEANNKLSWWKQNKKKKPVKYDALSVLSDSDPKQDSFKWYYPTQETSTTTTTRMSTSSSTTEHSSSFEEKTTKSGEDGALSWLQWIAERSKLKQKTTTKSSLTSKSSESSPTTTTTLINDPFIDVFQRYSDPPMIQSTTVYMETQTSKMTPSSTKSSTTSSSSSTSSSASLTDLGTWSWWTPVHDTGETKYEEYLLVESENKKQESVTEAVTTAMSTISHEENDDETEVTTEQVKSTSVDQTTLDTLDMEEKETMDDKTNDENDADDELRSKYVKLVEHNSQLVDLLKTTMQIQTDMFRKLIHYVFP